MMQQKNSFELQPGWSFRVMQTNLLPTLPIVKYCLGLCILLHGTLLYVHCILYSLAYCKCGQSDTKKCCPLSCPLYPIARHLIVCALCAMCSFSIVQGQSYSIIHWIQYERASSIFISSWHHFVFAIVLCICICFCICICIYICI